MMIEFGLFGALVSLAWLFSVSRPLMVPVVISFLIFSSKLIPSSLLLLMLLQVFAYIQSALGSRRETSGITQRRFGIVFLGVVMALFGSALGAEKWGGVLVFTGLLLVIPNGLTTFFYQRYYERLTLSSYIASVLLPGFVAIDILLKSKAGLQAELGPWWDYGVLGVGTITILISSLLALVRMKFNALLVFWSQAWIGIALVLLGSESEQLTPVVISAIAIFVLSTVSLLSFASQIGDRYYAFARMAAMGLPGMIGFSSVYFSIKMGISMGGWILGLLFTGYVLLMMGLVACPPGSRQEPHRKVRIRFWMVAAVQLFSGVGLFWLGTGGLK